MKLLTFPSELQAFNPRSPHAAQGVMSNPLDKTLLDTAAPRIQNRCFRQAKCFAPQVGGANSVKETPQPDRGFLFPQRHWGLVVRQVQLCNPLASLDMIPRSSPVSFSRTH